MTAWQDHAEHLFQASQQHPERSHRLSMGGSSTVTGALLSRAFTSPWYQLKTPNSSVSYITASGDCEESRRRGYTDFLAPWSGERFSIHGGCAVTATPLSFQQNRFNNGYRAEVVVRRWVQTQNSTWSSSQQPQMALRQHFGSAGLQKQRQPCWFVTIAWVF